ncbi:MAG: hypothetical protein HRT35_00415 [Algicola sp.]|nr:hypothetical protein [Algicola sp.]
MRFEIFSGIYQGQYQLLQELENFMDSHKAEVYSYLPFAIGELTYELTSKEFLQIICRYGSRKIYLGKHKIKLEATLDMTISDDKYDKLISVSDSSGYIEIPSRWGVFNLLRRIAYEKAYREGMEADDIVRIFGITKRTIANLKHRM